MNRQEAHHATQLIMLMRFGDWAGLNTNRWEKDGSIVHPTKGCKRSVALCIPLLL